MPCFSINLFTILPRSATHVITSLRRGGLFAELKKQIPGHIGCSILESDLTTDLYLVIDFWQSQFDFFEAEISPLGIVLADALDRMAYRHSTLGPFSFPPSPDAIAEESVGNTTESTSAEFMAEVDAELVRD